MAKGDIVKEWVTKAGYKAMIAKIHLPLEPVDSDRNYLCGYVFVDKDHHAFYLGNSNPKISKIKIELEITCTDITNIENYKGMYRLGFYMDYDFFTAEEKLDLNYATKECEKLALGLKKIENKVSYGKRKRFNKEK